MPACLLAIAAHTNIALTPSTQQAVSVKTVSSNMGNYQDTANPATDVNGMSQLFSTTTLNVVAGALLAARLAQPDEKGCHGMDSIFVYTAPYARLSRTHSHAHVPLFVC